MVKIGELPFKLGIAPINWANDDLPDLGDHYSFEDIITDISSLGYESTEMGRKFPADGKVLWKKLSAKNLQLSSKFIGTHFSVAELLEAELQAFSEWVHFLLPLGVKHIIACEMGGSMHWDKNNTGENMQVNRLNEEGWESLVDGLHKAGVICKENGIELVYHPHGGTVVESPKEIDKLMAMTDPSLVHLLYDTGHVYYGEGDPLRILVNYYDRIKYVHFKDVRKSVFDEAQKNDINFRTAVRKGVFTVPGDGDIDFKPILNELLNHHYDGWVVIEAEQDPKVHDPYLHAKNAKEYVEGIVSRLRQNI